MPQVDAEANTFVVHVNSAFVAPFVAALTLCTRTSTGKPCSFATQQMSSTLLALANPRHLVDFVDHPSSSSNSNRNNNGGSNNLAACVGETR